MNRASVAEVNPEDPFVKDLSRRAIRLLNDPTLERWQREKHIRNLQKILLDYQAKQAAKATRLQSKGLRGMGQRREGGSGIADASQILTRRREFEQAPQAGLQAIESQVAEPAPAPYKAAYNATPRTRAVLSLKREQ